MFAVLVRFVCVCISTAADDEVFTLCSYQSAFNCFVLKWNLERAKAR